MCGAAGFGEAVVGLYQISRARTAQQAQVGGAEACRLFTAAQAVFQAEAVDLPQFAAASLGNQAVAADGAAGAAVSEAGVLGVQLRLRHADFAVGRGYFLPAVGNAGGDDGQSDGGKQCHDADNGDFRAFVAADVPAVGRGIADVEVVAQAQPLAEQAAEGCGFCVIRAIGYHEVAFSPAEAWVSVTKQPPLGSHRPKWPSSCSVSPILLWW